MRLVLVTCLVILAESETGKYRAVCPAQPIEAEEGDDVTLECRLDPRVNVVNYTVDWKRADLSEVVHAYRHKQDHHHPQVDQYRDRTTLNHEDLSRGTLTLLVSSVQMSDSGPYKCFVPKWRVSCIMNLRVVKRNQNKTKTDTPSTTRPLLEEVTRPDNSGGENRKFGPAVIILTVFSILFVFIVVLVLRSRMIQDGVKRFRGRTEEKPETAANGCEMKKLDTKAVNSYEDLNSPAGNSLGIIVLEV